MEIRQGNKKIHCSRKYVIPRQKVTTQGDCWGVNHSENQCRVSGEEKEKVLYYLIPFYSFDWTDFLTSCLKCLWGVAMRYERSVMSSMQGQVHWRERRGALLCVLMAYVNVKALMDKKLLYIYIVTLCYSNREYIVTFTGCLKAPRN